MKLLEIIQNLLKTNKYAYAYANYKTATENNDNREIKSNVMTFWQPQFDRDYDRPILRRKEDDKNDKYERQVVERSQPSDVIRKARKLAKKITKIGKETPKSLAHYLSKEDIENLELLSQELTDALKEIRAAKRAEEENPFELD